MRSTIKDPSEINRTTNQGLDLETFIAVSVISRIKVSNNAERSNIIRVEVGRHEAWNRSVQSVEGRA